MWALFILLVVAQMAPTEGENKLRISFDKTTFSVCFHQPELAIIADFFLNLYCLRRRNIYESKLLIQCDLSQVDLSAILEPLVPWRVIFAPIPLLTFVHRCFNVVPVCAAKKCSQRRRPVACGPDFG